MPNINALLAKLLQGPSKLLRAYIDHANGPAAPVASTQEIADLLKTHQMPAILLCRQWPLGHAAGARSYFGGAPTLPEDIVWPRSGETGFALHFLAQINCADMPKIAGGPTLPEAGTLFFFADIYGEMLWDEAPLDCTRVLFAVENTQSIAPTALPENLPFIGHKLQQMDGGYEYYRRKTYPFWPVSPHIIETYDESQHTSAGSAYGDAVFERMIAQMEAHLPNKSLAPRPTLFELSTNGSPQFCPDKFGGIFPYSLGISTHFLEAIHEKTKQNIESCQYLITFYRHRLTPANEAEAEQEEQKMAGLIALEVEIKALLHTLKTASTEDTFSSIRAWVSGHSSHADFRKTLSNILADSARHAAWSRAAQADLPAGFLARFESVLQPNAENASHMIFGAKSTRTNPTEGHGIKLLQLDSDQGNGFMFCDSGIVDFWISEGDMKARCFERAYGATAGGQALTSRRILRHA